MAMCTVLAGQSLVVHIVVVLRAVVRTVERIVVVRSVVVRIVVVRIVGRKAVVVVVVD